MPYPAWPRRPPAVRPVPLVSGPLVPGWFRVDLGSNQGQLIKGSSAAALEPLLSGAFVVVAGAGFEPATSGL